MPPSTEMLQLLIEQMDGKHREAHMRLRRDVTDGFIAVNEELETLTAEQRADHDTLIAQRAMRERRQELSSYKAVIIAATIGGGCQVVVVLLTQLFALLRGAP